MKAVQINQYGDNSVLQNVEIEVPTLLANQVLVEVKASSVNPVDFKIRTGFMASMMPKQFPFTLGWEAAGVVKEVGSEVKNFKAGDEVMVLPNFMQGGTYAEYVAVNENEAAIKPKSLDFKQSSTVPFSAGTAYTALVNDAGIQEGQKILIHGAGGAVGKMAVQIAKNKGLYVIGTAAGENIQQLKDLGIDEVIDYTTTDFVNVVKDLDVILDLVGGETLAKSYGLVKKGGIIVCTAQPPVAEELEKNGISGKMTFTTFNPAIFNEVINWIEEGKLKVPEPAVYQLENAKDALAAVENRQAKNKIVFEF